MQAASTEIRSAAPNAHHEMRWYVIGDETSIDSPALLVYPDRVKANIRKMLDIAGGPQRLWPHVKTHKMSAVIQLQLDAGIRQFKCATIAEAEMVAATGDADILVAHQAVGPRVQRFVRLMSAFPRSRFSIIVDNPASAEELSRAIVAAQQAGDCPRTATAGIWIDLDNGMRRCGIAPGPAAIDLYRSVSTLPGLEAVGLHVYDGHIRHTDLAERTAASEAAFAPIAALRHELIATDVSAPRVLAGGTPTFPVHAAHADRDVSPGTTIFWDASYARLFPDMQFQHAAVVLSRVISKPANDRLCLDLGYKSVAADPAGPRVVWLDLPEAQIEVHSEEHLTLSTPRAAQYNVGDVLYGIPMHVCPTCALYPAAVVVENHHVAGVWNVDARNRVITI